MDFRLTADQSALVEAIDKLAAQFEVKPTESRGFALPGGELDRGARGRSVLRHRAGSRIGRSVCGDGGRATWRVCRTRRNSRSPCWSGRSCQAIGPARWQSSSTGVQDVSSRRRAPSSSSKARASVSCVRPPAMRSRSSRCSRIRWHAGKVVRRERRYPAMRQRTFASGCVSRLRRRRADSCRPRWHRRSTISPSASSSGGRSAPSRLCAIAWPSAPCSPVG